MPAQPRARVVLLGASNLRWRFPLVIDTARTLLGQPLDVLAAHGLGRSYGLSQSFLFRRLPGITKSGLWDSLRKKPAAPSFALLTDIGNDIVYGSPTPAILAWIEQCLDRLLDVEARTVITLLPLKSLETLTPRRFAIARSIIFPARRLTLAGALTRARELDEQLRNLAAGRGIATVEPDPDWYGLDAIHIRKQRAGPAWLEILRAWQPEKSSGRQTETSPPRHHPLGHLQRERWTFFGLQRGKPQPCSTLADGTSISLY